MPIFALDADKAFAGALPVKRHRVTAAELERFAPCIEAFVRHLGLLAGPRAA